MKMLMNKLLCVLAVICGGIGSPSLSAHDCLTTERVAFMIDSAKADWDSVAAMNTPWTMPGIILDSILVRDLFPDSCMSIDTVWTLEHVSMPNVAYFRRTIDTTWGACDE